MLSDEEKEAIEKLSGKKNETTWDDTIRQIKREEIKDVVVTRQKYITAVLNLIKKQSKEIEHQIEKRAKQKKELAILNAKQVEFNKLVNTVNSYKGQFKRQQKEIEELKEIYQTGYVNGCVSKVYEINKKWKDKIKAKIEEVKDGTFDAKIVLQSLLEKE